MMTLAALIVIGDQWGAAEESVLQIRKVASVEALKLRNET
jgi:hypothetical protein